jgi:hypothetical protein
MLAFCFVEILRMIDRNVCSSCAVVEIRVIDYNGWAIDRLDIIISDSSSSSQRVPECEPKDSSHDDGTSYG